MPASRCACAVRSRPVATASAPGWNCAPATRSPSSTWRRANAARPSCPCRPSAVAGWTCRACACPRSGPSAWRGPGAGCGPTCACSSIPRWRRTSCRCPTSAATASPTALARMASSRTTCASTARAMPSARSPGRHRRVPTACWCGSTRPPPSANSTWTGSRSARSATRRASAASRAGWSKRNGRAAAIACGCRRRCWARDRGAEHRHTCLRALALMPHA